ncbi:MAG TPA: glycosyltransferase family 4 protein [Rhodanobacteraceae bacterium]|nr:glycosyltransferase family 4 protein [Rhodanobacteraceae bacterium]
MTRSRILIITRNLPPLVGGMERLNWHMAEELAKLAEVRVIGPQGAAALAPAGVTVREAPLKPLRTFLLRARKLARREAKSWRPDIVLAGSGLTAPLARAAAHVCGARTAAYVHGLDVATRHVVYRALWLPAIRRMDCVIANSHATADLCRGIGVDPTRIGIVHPGVDLPDLTADVDAGKAFRERHGLGDRPLLLSVGRLSARKGLREFVTRVLPRIVAAQPQVMLLIVGDAPHQALHAQAQTPASIQVAANSSGVGDHLRFLGTVTDYAELGAVYRAADVHVFPVRHIPNDPEGFGMVAVEAAAHGLPTVAFATGGIVDAVAERQSGYLVPQDDYEGLAAAVLRALSVGPSLRTGCPVFAARFAWPVFGGRLLTILLP